MGRKSDRLIKATPALELAEKAIANAIHNLQLAQKTLTRFPCGRDIPDATVAHVERCATRLTTAATAAVVRAAELNQAAGC